MTITNEAKRIVRRSEPGGRGPAATFTATVLVAFAALVPAAVILPKDFALAAISTLFFAFSALVALIAWCLGQPDKTTLSYWDVAGALTLFGICAATLMDSDQLIRFIESQRTTD
jgi:hypothetical protein